MVISYKKYMNLEIAKTHLFIILFLIFFSVLLFLFIRDRILNNNKTFVKVKKIKNNNQINMPHSVDQNTGVFLISIPIKPYGYKEDKTHVFSKKNNIDHIKYKGLFDMVVYVDKTLEETKVIIKGDKAFVDLVNVNFNKNFMEISHPQISCAYTIDCLIEVHIPNIEVFYNKGRGVIDIVNIGSKNFTFYQHGLESVYLSGFTELLRINSRSKGDVFAQKLKSNQGFIDNNGIGDIYCNIKKELNASIKYKGNIFLKDFNVSIKKTNFGEGSLIYRPFEDYILNGIFINVQKILKIKLK